MTALTNELFEEATRRSTELAARAQAGADAASNVVEHARALGLRALDEAKSAHEQYQETLAAVKHAAEEAREAAESAGHSLLAVPQEAQKAGAAVADLLTGVHDELVEMGALRARLMGGLSDSYQQAETEFHDLSVQVKEFTEHLDTRLKEAGGHVQHLHTVIESAGQELEKARQGMKEALADLGKVAGETTADVGHVLEQVLAAVSSGLVNFCNNAVTENNTLTATVRLGYGDETKEHPDPAETWVDTALQPVRDAIAYFSQFRPTAESMLADALTAILGEGEKAVSSLDAVNQSLHAALPRSAQ